MKEGLELRNRLSHGLAIVLILAGAMILSSGSGINGGGYQGLTGSPDDSLSQYKNIENSNQQDASSFNPGGVNFPSFRGKNGRGIAGGDGYPTSWDGETGKNIRWKVQLPKTGKSSPVIWNDKIFVTGAEGIDCELYCLDKWSGKLLWRGSVSGFEGEPDEAPEMDFEAGMAVSTAVADSGSVCAIFANGNIACFDHSGIKKWGYNLSPPKNIYGFASSLAIYNDLIYVQYDSDERVSLMAIEINTGKIRWETKRRGGIVWSSPVIATFNGTAQVILNGNPYVMGFNALTGEELWAVECMSGDVAPSVAANSRYVYAVTDYARLAAINPNPVASIVWEDNYFTPDVSSPAANEEYLFLSTGNGDVACYDALKGDTLWTHFYYGQFYASPIIADNKVWLLERNGLMHVLSAGKEYRLIGESPLGEPADCTPAFSEKRIYIRGRNNLYCIGME